MRTPKRLYPDERIIYKPELLTCPHCEGPLMLCDYLAWDKTVQTLEGVLSIGSRPAFCAKPSCAGHSMRLLSAEGQQLAPRGCTYGYDVLARIGWLRQERRDTYSELRAELTGQVHISTSHIRYLYQQVYLPLLACHERQSQHSLADVAGKHGGLIIGLDGLAPEGGEAQLWFIRELQSGLSLRSGWLSRFDQATFEAFLRPLAGLAEPILAVVSDKQKGLPEAVATVLPQACHHFCHAHYLKNLAEPLAEADSAFTVELRKAVRAEVGTLIRTETLTATSQTAVLTVTGLLPDAAPTPEDPPAAPVASDMADTVVADAIVTQLLRHTRYLLTLKGRPPLRLVGIEVYQRLQNVAALSQQLLAQRHNSRLAVLSQGLQAALAPFAAEYHELQQGASWLRDIDHLLQPTDGSPATGQEVAHQLRTYLDGLLAQANCAPQLAAFRSHLHKVSASYWPGLFHCYNIAGLPRTNNNLESHFRDTQRRLLRTSGQRGQTRRTLQRIGAWELLSRPSTEAQRLAALRQIPFSQFAQEQDRFQRHQERFRLHTRSSRRLMTQFDHLREQWLVFAATSTG